MDGVESVVRYQITYLDRSVLIWVGVDGTASACSMESLAASFPAASIPGVSRDLPAGTGLLGGSRCEISKRVASMLATRLGMPVYASIQLEDDSFVVHQVLERLLKELVD